MKHHSTPTILLLFVIYWQKVINEPEITPFCTANGHIRLPPPKNYLFDYRVRMRMLYGSDKVPVENLEFETASIERGEAVTVHVPVSLRLEPATFSFDHMGEGRRKGINIKVSCARADDCEYRTGLLLRLGLGCATKTFATPKDYLMLLVFTSGSVALLCAPFSCYAAIGFFVRSIQKPVRKYVSTILYFVVIVFGVYILLPGFFGSSSNGFNGGHAVQKSKKTQFMTPSELRSVAEPGDTIQFKRFQYLHAGVIRRNDKYGFDVVHVDGSKVGPEERVIESPVSVIAGVGGLVCIDNALDSVLTPADRALIMERLDQAVGTIVPYHVVDNNCEHFASLMRYGHPMSPQIEASSDYTKRVLYAGTWLRSWFIQPISKLFSGSGKAKQFNTCEPMQSFKMTGCVDCQAGPTLEYQCSGDTSFLSGKPRLDGRMVCPHFEIRTVCDSKRRVLHFSLQQQPDDVAGIQHCSLQCSYNDEKYEATKIKLQAQLTVVGDHTYDKWLSGTRDVAPELNNNKTSAEAQQLAEIVSLIGLASGLLIGVLEIWLYIICGRRLGKCFFGSEASEDGSPRRGCFMRVLREIARGFISCLLGFLRKCLVRLEQGKENSAENATENSTTNGDCRAAEAGESPETPESRLMMVHRTPPVHPVFG